MGHEKTEITRVDLLDRDMDEHCRTFPLLQGLCLVEAYATFLLNTDI